MQGAEKPFFPVLAAGLLTTVVTLAGVHFLNMNTNDWNIMGWYANRVIPVGAILVGLLAASGYGLASWFLGIKINKRMMVAVVALQLVAYIAAQYIEYLDVLGQVKQMFGGHDIGGKLTFFKYFDMAARSMAWQDKYSSNAGTPLGVWGYGLRALEVIGFCGGGLIAPAALYAHPFCERCQRYMRGKSLTVIPAAPPQQLFKKTDPQAQQAVTEAANDYLKRVSVLAHAGDMNGFKDLIGELKGKQKEANAAPLRFSVEMMRCPVCHQGFLRVARVEQKGRNLERKELPEKIALSPEFTRALS